MKTRHPGDRQACGMPCVQANRGQQRPMNPPETAPSWSRRGWREDMRRLDLAVYAAVAATPTPTLDRFFGRVSAAADRSRIWLAHGRRACGGRRWPRPRRRCGRCGLHRSDVGRRQPRAQTARRSAPAQPRHLRHPRRPSGRDAAEHVVPFGACGIRVCLRDRRRLRHAGSWLAASCAAAVVAYSRVHTGVHYPADVVVGSVTGAALGQVAVALRRRSPLRRGRAR